MKYFYLLFSFLSFLHTGFTQEVEVSGECIESPVSLSSVGDVDGKPAYAGTGTVAGNPNVAVSVFWIEADAVWVIAFDGQPYFMNSCVTEGPVSTTNLTCPWTAVTDMTCDGLEALSVTGSAVLAVRYANFIAKESGGKVELQWSTSQETNNKGFSIERATDGINWMVIGSLRGAGSSTIETSYRFIDHIPAEGKNFYRLVQEDLDGVRSYSKVVSINMANSQPFSYWVRNNPGKGIFQLSTRSTTKVDLSVIDLTGKILIQRSVNNGLHQLDLSNYAPGLYLLQMKLNNQLITTKLIKQ